MNFCCIADEETVRGFRLAGVSGEVVVTPAQAATALKKAVAQPDCGILILTEPVADGIRGQVDAIRLERSHPLIIEIPAPSGPRLGRRSLRQVVQAAVGIRID